MTTDENNSGPDREVKITWDVLEERGASRRQVEVLIGNFKMTPYADVDGLTLRASEWDRIGQTLFPPIRDLSGKEAQERGKPIRANARPAEIEGSPEEPEKVKPVRKPKESRTRWPKTALASRGLDGVGQLLRVASDLGVVVQVDQHGVTALDSDWQRLAETLSLDLSDDD